MEYNAIKKEIILNRKLSNLDKFVLEFLDILQKYADYVIISGYVSILLGRSRATEDVDVFIKKIDFEQFSKLYKEISRAGFWCINAEDSKEVFSYIKDGLAIRFARKNNSIPNIEIKFTKRKIDEETFQDFIIVDIKGNKLKISSLERQIAFKKYYLSSEKDIEDAMHLEELFKEKIDYAKINKLKKSIENIKLEESANEKR